MKINENIVLSMVAPHVVDNALTYDKFDELFAMLSRSEQYSVTDLLAAHHIELRDADDDLAQAYATEFTADSADQPLFDHSVFGGNDPTACSWLQMRRGFQSNEQLAKAAHAGNRDAWNALCSQNQKLVMKYAVRYTGMYGNNLSTEELISAGNEGLVKGIERFDETLGFAFSTYVVWWIRQSIFREIANNGYTIRIPVHMHEKIHKITRMESELARKGLGLQERITEIARALGNSEDQVMECIQLRQQVMKCASLDMPLKDDTDAVLGDFVPADEKDNPENLLELMCLKTDLLDVLHTLTAREEQIIIKRYGLDGMGERTLEEIGKELGVTRERIRQIEQKAMRKLAHPSRSRLLKDYLEVA